MHRLHQITQQAVSFTFRSVLVLGAILLPAYLGSLLTGPF